ncbi:MFS transporter [Corynebacterium mendelii]|uniref:MFS transporter n=1 Tax=Corynebacterium mendelii TaxID=2765362 RepID=UPI002ED39791
MNKNNVSLIALIAIALTATNMRAAVTALSPLVPLINNDLHLGGTMVGLLGMIPTAMFALAAFATPTLLQAWSGPRMLMIAMLLTTAGEILRVIGPHTGLLFAGTALALFAVGITNAAVPLAVRQFFPARVPAVSMVYLVAMQAGMLAAPLTVEPVANLFDRNGWQYSLGSWSLLAFLAALAWIPLAAGPAGATTTTAGHPAARQRSLPVWTTPVGLGLAVMFGFTSFASYGMMMFVPAFFTTAGASVGFGALMLSVWSGVGLILAIAAPYAVDRFRDPFWVIVVCAILFFIGNTGMATAPMAAPWVWILFSAAGPLSFPMALTLVNVRARTMEGARSLSSFCQGAGYTMACGGPFFMGFLREVTNGWFWPNVVLTASLIAICIGGFFATRQVFVEDQLLSADTR